MKESENVISRNIFLILLGFFFIILLYFSHLMAGFLVPIFIAFFTAMFLYPFIDRLHKTKVPNWPSNLIVYLVFILIVAIFITVLSLSLANFVADLPEITQDFTDRIVDPIRRISQMPFLRFSYH